MIYPSFKSQKKQERSENNKISKQVKVTMKSLLLEAICLMSSVEALKVMNIMGQMENADSSQDIMLAQKPLLIIAEPEES